MSSFDPDGVGVANGNIFGFPVSYEEADIVLHGIPWDVTASYGKGTSNAPQNIINASVQLDFYHPKLKDAFATKIYHHPINKDWKNTNDKLLPKAMAIIDTLELGKDLSTISHQEQDLEKINKTQERLKQHYAKLIDADINNNKLVGVIGGEHSVPLCLIERLAVKHKFAILQIDAHADLRNSYEGFTQSHASIMFNALKLNNVTKLVQVGVRDVANAEVKLINDSKGRINTFYDWDLKEAQFEGETWQSQVQKIIAVLPEKVYVSYDIDGLKPSLCLNTGTPVPGGFNLEEVNYLLYEIVKSGKKIIGFDLCEVGDSEFDANIGARALWNLVCAIKSI